MGRISIWILPLLVIACGGGGGSSGADGRNYGYGANGVCYNLIDYTVADTPSRCKAAGYDSSLFFWNTSTSKCLDRVYNIYVDQRYCQTDPFVWYGATCFDTLKNGTVNTTYCLPTDSPYYRRDNQCYETVSQTSINNRYCADYENPINTVCYGTYYAFFLQRYEDGYDEVWRPVSCSGAGSASCSGEVLFGSPYGLPVKCQ